MAGNAVIALCGKGGSGKTSMAALMTRAFLEDGTRRVLAIDADPAAGLAFALGFRGTRTVDDIRRAIIERVESGGGLDAKGAASLLDYELFSALEERGRLAFLAVGRPESEGCYCKVNLLLKDSIAALAGSFDVTIIDGEAGVEQVNRRVMDSVTHLVLVSDASARGLNVAAQLASVAPRYLSCREIGLVLNRLKDPAEASSAGLPPGVRLIGAVIEDGALRGADMEGRPLADAPGIVSLAIIREALRGMGLL